MTAARQPPGAARQEPSAEALAAARNVVLYGPQTIALFDENDRRIALALDAFAAEAVTAERERCAKIAEAWQKANNRRYGDDIGENIAAAIRNTP